MDEEEAVEQEEAEEAEPEPDTEADSDPDSDAAVAPVASPSTEDGGGIRQAGTHEQRAAEGPVLRILPLGSGLVLIGSGLALALAGLRLRRG
ncbi:hypothetical protein [Streptomyces sp. CAI-85]|uniref:hypothetical protein n=1 Tax=Streptomyces sp. CAI-85 TaxID=1472662 RepID=UPI0020CA3EA8|nr:hypothetical protein [Streptomyces sp. CAI-85]